MPEEQKSDFGGGPAGGAAANVTTAEMKAPRRANAIGIDVGTYTLQAARRGPNGKVAMREEINGFLHVKREERTSSMQKMILDAGAPMIEHDNDIYVFGQAGLDIAYSWDREFRRPMKDGIVSAQERDAMNLLQVVLRSIMCPLDADQTVVVYSSPARPLNNTQRSVEFHQALLQSIFDQTEIDGKRVRAFPMNEAAAIVKDQLDTPEHRNTGIGLSFGAGMVNASYCVLGVPVFEFSLVGSGDWIDQATANATGESVTYINQLKHKISLSEATGDFVAQSIQVNYRLLISTIAKGIVKGIIDHNRRTKAPCPIVVGGGTASPAGFVELLDQQLREQLVAQKCREFEIGKIWLAPDHARSVARGLLYDAETRAV